MPKRNKLDELIEEVTVDASSYDENLWAFHTAFEDEFDLPVDGHLFGEPVEVQKVDYDGNERRGLTATCKKGRTKWTASLADVEVRPGQAADLLDAYRRVMGLKPIKRTKAAKTRQKKHKVSVEDVEVGKPIDVVVLAVKQKATRLRVLGSEREITLRAALKAVPGEIASVTPKKVWTYAKHPYMSADDASSIRLDVPALGLVPLKLEDMGEWRPDEHYWGEEDEPLEAWAQPIYDGGPRPQFEMEQVVPGEDPMAFDDGAILRAIHARDTGDPTRAFEILNDLLTQDLRCLDAHAHLGNFEMDCWPGRAMRHYKAGVEIGKQSLGEDFRGVLPWGCIDNRPFLRCLHGYGLCLWRNGAFEEALRVYDWMLWLNPSDNIGARFLLPDLQARRSWEEFQEAEAGYAF